jgi:hypothetical protein
MKTRIDKATKNRYSKTLWVRSLPYPPEKHIRLAARGVLSVCPMSLCPVSTP